MLSAVPIHSTYPHQAKKYIHPHRFSLTILCYYAKMNVQIISIPCLGYSLAADWYENENSDKVIFALLGYSSSKERNRDFLMTLGEKSGANVLAIDLSGHGENPFELDKTRPAQHLLETVEVFDWLRNTHSDTKITVLGTSYGGFLAAYLTRYRNFHKLILRTPAIYLPADLYSLQNEIDRDYTSRIYRKDKQAVANHPLFQQASVFNGKTLLVIHELDENVPVQTTDIYKDVFSADSYVVAGFKHSMRDVSNPIENIPAYQDAIANWLVQ